MWMEKKPYPQGVSSAARSASSDGPASLLSPNRGFAIPWAVLEKLRSLRLFGGLPERGQICGMSRVLPLHRLSLLPALRVVDAQCLNSLRDTEVLTNPRVPLSSEGLSAKVASPPISPSELLRKLAENRVSAVSRGDLFPFEHLPASPNTWSTQWRSYPALFPRPIASRAERCKACLLHFFLNAWFLYVPAVLYTLYRRHCTTKRSRLIFVACVLLMVLWPPRRYLPSRRWRIWRLLHRYHRATVIVEDAKSLPPTKPTLFTALPHAIVPVAQV